MKNPIIAIIITVMGILSSCAAENGVETQTTAATETAAQSSVTETSKPTVTAPIRNIDPDKPMVALTFDDGPNLTTTMNVLSVLEENNVVASFFLVGNNITPSTERVILRAWEMGCEIDNHSKSHSYMNRMTEEEILEEVNFVSDKVEEITGEPTKFFRPPFIAVSDEMYSAIDMPFICGAGCNDWDSKVTKEQRVENTLSQVKDGTIILLHDSQGNTQTVEALKEIIPALLDEGYQFVTVGELFEAKGVEIDSEDTNLYTVVG